MKTSESSLGHNRQIYDAIRAISHHLVVNPQTNSPYNSENNVVSGHVVKIHDDENDELFGTIDVQDFNTQTVNADDEAQEGLYVGVKLAAIQNSSLCAAIVPKLHSDVLITRDAGDYSWYVTMFSHVDILRFDAQTSVSIGVTEREEYDNEDENGPDIDELEPTGVRAVTTYTKEGVITEVVDEENEKQVIHLIDSESIGFDVAGGKTTFNANQDEVTLERDDASVTIKKGEQEFAVGQEVVKVKTDGVYLGSETGTSPAVLGDELGVILCEILDLIAQIKVTTQLGPQPPINLAQFVLTKVKINAWANAVTKFLTPKVNIQQR